MGGLEAANYDVHLSGDMSEANLLALSADLPTREVVAISSWQLSLVSDSATTSAYVGFVSDMAAASSR
jgi:hypothetical protein